MHPAAPMVRTASAETSLSHPAPDLQSPQGGFLTHVERLEHHAERMSSSGSDIGDEIRRLQLEDRLSTASRRSSLLSAQGQPDTRALHLQRTRSRNASTSSYSNSIVDVNQHARWGGYSPQGVTSPLGSLRSASWSQASLHRLRTASKMTEPPRLGQTEETSELEHDEEPTTAHSTPHVAAAHPHTRHTSHFSLEYDKIVQDIQAELDSPVEELRQHSVAHSNPEHQTHTYSATGLPDRPPTADTFRQVQDAFHDFDGVHCAPSVRGPRGPSDGSRYSVLRSMPHSMPSGPPPPQEGMVYYPAPVPRMLNLPKRLSQLPSPQAKRRSQMLASQPPEARNSALWLGGADNGASPDKTRSVLPPQLRASMYFDQSTAPPHELDLQGDSAEAALDGILDASANAPVNAFIDHPHAGNVNGMYSKETKRKSAATLINAVKNPESPTKEKKEKKRRSSINLLFGRKSSTDLTKMSKRNSSGDKLGKLQKRSSSRLSLGTELDEPASGHKRQVSNMTDTSGVDEGTPLHEADDPLNPHHPYHEDEEDEPDFHLPPDQFPPQQIGAPTTLLAELQMRKAQQRTRNRTAATAYPNGMHNTLLQLDAVAEVEKKRRMHQKINLAWEEEQAAQEDDDDVPLGMLFPGRDGLISKVPGAAGQRDDWDRPLGLLEKKDLEDNEPLSSRRNRLRGLAPMHNISRDPSPGKRSTVIGLQRASPAISVTPSPEPPHSDHDEDEPLAARKERLRRSQMLNQALGDMSSRPISGDFASEMMSQFGGLDVADAPAAQPSTTTPLPPPTTTTPINEEDETLGQRRARLQAQAAANGTAPTRPGLKPSYSMADILTAVPQQSKQKLSTDAAFVASLNPDSLLSRSERTRERQRKIIREQNKRSTTYAGNPSIGGHGGGGGAMMDFGGGGRNVSGGSEERGLLGAHAAGTTAGRAKSMAFGSAMSLPLAAQTPMSAPMGGMGMGAAGAGGYFGQQQMPVQAPGYGVGVPGMGVGMMPVQQPMMGYGGMNGFVGYAGTPGTPGGMGMPMMNPMMGYGQGGMPMGMPMGAYGQGAMGMGMGMGAQAEQPMPVEQGRRDAIDRWRQGVL